MTTCEANHGPSHVVFSLGGLEMLSPSYRLAEQPLITYRLSNVSITTAERSRPISCKLTDYIELFGYITFAIPRSILFVTVAKLGLLNYLVCVINQPARLIALFLDSRQFLTRPTARKTRSGDPAQNKQSIAFKKVLNVYYVKIEWVKFFFRERKCKTRSLVKAADATTEHWTRKELSFTYTYNM